MLKRIKPLTSIDKIVLDHLGKKADDIGYIRSYNVFTNHYRVNLHETSSDKILESFWVRISEGKVISCERG